MLQVAEVEGRANQAESDLAELQEATASSGSSIEEWRSAYADLQQQHASTQVTINATVDCCSQAVQHSTAQL